MAVKHPVARASRHPARGHRTAGRHQLGHHLTPHLGPVDGVRRPAPAAVDLVVEAVQMHRVRAGGGVHPAPADRVAYGVIQPLGFGPGLPIDHHELPLGLSRARVAWLESQANHEDPLLLARPHARGIDDEGARELAVEPASVLHRRAGGGSPVVVGAGRARREAHVAGGPGRHLERVVRQTGTGVQTPQHQRRVGQPVVDRRVDHRAFDYAYQRTGHLERLPGLGEGLHQEAGAVVRLGREHPSPELEPDGEDAVAQTAGGGAIGVRDDPLGHRGTCHRPRWGPPGREQGYESERQDHPKAHPEPPSKVRSGISNVTGVTVGVLPGWPC